MADGGEVENSLLSELFDEYVPLEDGGHGDGMSPDLVARLNSVESDNPVLEEYVNESLFDDDTSGAAFSISDDTHPLDAFMGMVGDEWHGPKPPGEGWFELPPGPRGGKRWRRGAGGPAQPGTPGGQAGQPQQPTQEAPGEAQAIPEGWTPYVGQRGARKGQKGFRSPAGRVVWGDTPPGRKMPPRLSADEAKAHVEELLADPAKLTPEALKATADVLNSMTVSELQKLKAALGAGGRGGVTERTKKGGLAEKIVRRAAELRNVTPPPVQPPQPPVEPPQPPAVEPTQPPAVEPPAPVEPPPVQPPVQPPEPPAPQRRPPKPAEPGFTGFDTLGREWRNGELVPAEPEPPKLRRPGAPEPTPGRVLKVSSGPLPQLSDQAKQDIQSLLRVAPGTVPAYRPVVNDYDSGQNKEAVKRLQDEGLIRPYGFTRPGDDPTRGAQELTEKGVLAMYGASGGTQDAPDPADERQASALATLYTLSSDEDRKRLVEHFKITPQEPDTYDGRDFEKDMRAMVVDEKEHVAVKIRQNKELMAAVDGLTHGFESPELEELKYNKAQDAVLADEIRAVTGRSYADVYSLEYMIEAEERQLLFPNVRGKKKIRGRVEALKKIKAKFDALIERRRELNEMKYAVKYDRAADFLKGRVKDGGPLTVEYHQEIAPTARASMEKAQALLDGAISKPKAGAFPDFRGYKTYQAKNSDGSPDSRAHYNAFAGTINTPEGISVKTAIHEMMHGIDDNDPGINAAVEEFREYRLKGDKGTMMKKFGDFYGDFEIGYKDEFDKIFPDNERSAYYMGKPHEILTMLSEAYFDDPAGLAQRDPEACAFFLGILDGSLRKYKQGAP